MDDLKKEVTIIIVTHNMQQAARVSDTTAFFLSRKLRDFPEVHISSIARGIPMGGELEYADEITLGRSIVDRQRQVGF